MSIGGLTWGTMSTCARIVGYAIIVGVVGAGYLLCRIRSGSKIKGNRGRGGNVDARRNRHSNERNGRAVAKRGDDASILQELRTKWNLPEVRDGFNFTKEWLIGFLDMGLQSDYCKMDAFLGEIIAASDGRFCAAACEGDCFDYRMMESSRILPTGAKVRKVEYRGLVRTDTGAVVLKAEVL